MKDTTVSMPANLMLENKETGEWAIFGLYPVKMSEESERLVRKYTAAIENKKDVRAKGLYRNARSGMIDVSGTLNDVDGVFYIDKITHVNGYKHTKKQ